MRLRLPDQKSESMATDDASKNKRRRKNNYTDNFGNADEAADEEPNHLRGGVLRAGELKAVTDEVKDVESFHRLGDGVLSPPPSASPEGDDVKMEGADNIKRQAVYTSEETGQLEDIIEKKDKVRAYKRLLDDKDRLLDLVLARRDSVLAELKEKDKSISTICGFDPRLTWSDQEFTAWRESAEGKGALGEGGILGPPSHLSLQDPVKHESNGIYGNENDISEINGNANGHVDEIKKDGEEEEIGRGVCRKKRCERHRAWLKLQQHELQFELHQARLAMKKLEVEEKGVRDRAMIRGLEAKDR